MAIQQSGPGGVSASFGRRITTTKFDITKKHDTNLYFRTADKQIISPDGEVLPPATSALPQDGTFYAPKVSSLYFVATLLTGTGTTVVQLLGSDGLEVGRFNLDTLNAPITSSQLTGFPAGIKPVVLSGNGTYSIVAQVTRT